MTIWLDVSGYNDIVFIAAMLVIAYQVSRVIIGMYRGK